MRENSYFTEDNLVESPLVEYITNLWDDKDCFINAYSEDEDLLGRKDKSEVILFRSLLKSLKLINPNLSSNSLEKAVNELSKNRMNSNPVKTNKEIYYLIRDGYLITDNEDEEESELVKFIDFDNIEKNEFKLVSQLWIQEGDYTRRPDLIVFVNGLPLIVIEAKNLEYDVYDAYNNNIRDYRDTIPKLFWFNLAIIITNGLDSKVGSTFSSYEFFNEWNDLNNTSETNNYSKALFLFESLLKKEVLLDIFENFVLFNKNNAEKYFPRYFQYFGVNSTYQALKSNPENKKLGVFWHTQGSGKSMSNIFLTTKISRKISDNYTYVVLTDTTELDSQILDDYLEVDAAFSYEHPRTIKGLKKVLSEDHRYIFTIIHLFQDIENFISDRNNIIVLADEAHRTQYGILATNMRKALPNAYFLGFTGTPLIDKEGERTREIFGDYTSIYNFADSVNDNVTVPLFHENRVPPMKLVNEDFFEDLTKLMEEKEINLSDEEKILNKYSGLYEILTRDQRLDWIAEDIVTHYSKRGFDGKALVVSVDKATSVRMYIKFKKSWDEYLEKLKIKIDESSGEEKILLESELNKNRNLEFAVMVSKSQNEVDKLKSFGIDMKEIRKEIDFDNLQKKFQDPSSKLKIVFVCKMWLTGFNVKDLAYMYLDKPMKNHTLMQAIARSNRVYENKTSGLIVDYIDIFKDLEKALAIYASGQSNDEFVIQDKEVLIKDFINKYEEIDSFLLKIDVSIEKLIEVNKKQLINLIEESVEKILFKSEIKDEFIKFSSEIIKVFLGILPNVTIESYYEKVKIIKILKNRIFQLENPKKEFPELEIEIQKLLDESIKLNENKKPKNKILDLSKLNPEKLQNYFDSIQNKAIEAKILENQLREMIDEVLKVNQMRVKFLEKLENVIRTYNLGTLDVETLLNKLIEITKDLSKQEIRSKELGLSQQEIAIFDMLNKENLNITEVESLKNTSKKLLNNILMKITPQWKNTDQLKSEIRVLIRNDIYNYLPKDSYSDEECKDISYKVFNHILEHYPLAS